MIFIDTVIFGWELGVLLSVVARDSRLLRVMDCHMAMLALERMYAEVLKTFELLVSSWQGDQGDCFPDA